MMIKKLSLMTLTFVILNSLIRSTIADEDTEIDKHDTLLRGVDHEEMPWIRDLKKDNCGHHCDKSDDCDGDNKKCKYCNKKKNKCTDKKKWACGKHCDNKKDCGGKCDKCKHHKCRKDDD